MEQVKEVVKSNTAEMNRAMQRNSPVDTGFLKRSIVLRLANGGLTGISGATAEYAPYLEYGTRFMSAQPFIKPAFRVQSEKFMQDMKSLVK